MRTIALLAAVAVVVPFAARADEVDLSDTTARRNNKVPTFAFRAEGGSEYSPYGMVGGVFSLYSANPLGAGEIEFGGGVGTPGDKGNGVQLGLALRQLLGEQGDYFAFELSIAGNTKKKLGYDLLSNHTNSSATWSSLGIGFEHRQGFISLGLIVALSFGTSFDLVPHPMVHGGLGIGF